MKLARLLLHTLFMAVASIAEAATAYDDVWHLQAADTAGYFPPAVGNGHTGVVIDRTGVSPSKVYQSTVFDDGEPGKVSTIRPAVIPLSLDITVDGSDRMADWRQTLMMDSAVVTSSYSIGSVRITTTFRALRQMPHCVMAEVSLTAGKSSTVSIINRPVTDPTLTDVSVKPTTIWCEDGGIRLQNVTASYNGGRDRLATSTILIPEHGDWQRHSSDSLLISLKRGQTASIWVIASECSTADFSDPYNEADRQAIYAYRRGHDRLIADHNSDWQKLWQGDIVIDGNNELARQAHSALYNIYSSVREGSRRSIAPMGLTSDKYFGHIFWDADTWMFPVLAVLQPGLARSMVDYRFDGLPAARRRAAAHGYDGAMYPWESDHRGEESTPTFALTGPLEHHLTADVARAAWLYFCVTADTAWLRSEGYPMLEASAQFWADRVSPSATSPGRYTVENVVGADEYAIGVDGDAFTNASATRALEYATTAAQTLGYRPDPRWKRIAESMEYHYMPDGKVMREHSRYNGEMTKQADVELLAYPLGIVTDPEQIKANIDYYSTKIDPVGGPAMSHSAMAVNYARMGEPDKAAALIERAYRPNLRGPFNNLSETPGNNETYFMTAAGGLLQALIFGYAGIEITPDGITTVAHSHPSDIKSITIKRATTKF